ncbi:hypothetical protein [Modestobacter versicolor]|uniref:hypothetical protein n=1 Tax=Modestobacter versicolor TaxID=429133 RepID=UPI0034E00B8D
MDDDRAVREAVAAALAAGQEPDLSLFDAAQVRGALARALGGVVVRAEFATWLRDRVRTLTAGRVSVEGRPPDFAGGPCGRAPELALRRVVAGEPFAEPVVVGTDGPVVRFPMRGR